jgi:hypothetical protein
MPRKAVRPILLAVLGLAGITALVAPAASSSLLLGSSKKA